MNRNTLLLSVCIGTLAYVCVAFIAGRDGIISYKKLYEQKMILAENVGTVSKINAKLMQEEKSLKQDSVVIASYAKKLGYINNNEKIIKITGITREEKSVYDTGSIKRRLPIEFIPDKSCKIVGLLCFIISITIFSLISLRKKIHTLTKNSNFIGSVNDLQQV